MMFSTVPSPGRCRSGTHNASTTQLMANVAQPMLHPVRMLIPCASTVQGVAPSRAASRNASPVPNSHSPTSSHVRDPGVGRQTCGADQLVRGMVGEPRSTDPTRRSRDGLVTSEDTGAVFQPAVRTLTPVRRRPAGSGSS